MKKKIKEMVNFTELKEILDAIKRNADTVAVSDYADFAMVWNIAAVTVGDTPYSMQNF